MQLTSGLKWHMHTAILVYIEITRCRRNPCIGCMLATASTRPRPQCIAIQPHRLIDQCPCLFLRHGRIKTFQYIGERNASGRIRTIAYTHRGHRQCCFTIGDGWRWAGNSGCHGVCGNVIRASWFGTLSFRALRNCWRWCGCGGSQLIHGIIGIFRWGGQWGIGTGGYAICDYNSICGRRFGHDCTCSFSFFFFCLYSQTMFEIDVFFSIFHGNSLFAWSLSGHFRSLFGHFRSLLGHFETLSGHFRSLWSRFCSLCIANRGTIAPTQHLVSTSLVNNDCRFRCSPSRFTAAKNQLNNNTYCVLRTLPIRYCTIHRV